MRALTLPVALLVALCPRLLVGCKGNDIARSGADPADYTGPDGIYMVFGPAEDPAGGEPLLLRAEEGTWTLRLGAEWPSAEELASLEAAVDDGLRVGDTLMLPDPLIEGDAQEGATVIGFEDVEVYYGTFVDAVLVEIQGGDWAGEQAFGLGIGPVALTWGGQARELVYYE